MKTRFMRLFGIALTLAMVASLFVFTAPVSAASKTNDKFFPFSFSLSGSSTTSEISYNGPPTVLSDGVTSWEQPGRVRKAEFVITYSTCTGNFGPLGDLTSGAGNLSSLTATQIINYESGTQEYNGIYFLNFGTQGTLTCRVHNSRNFRYFYPVGSTTQIWDANAHYESISGTGLFENFHCQGRYWFDYSLNPAGVMMHERIGWLAPEKIT